MDGTQETIWKKILPLLATQERNLHRDYFWDSEREEILVMG